LAAATKEVLTVSEEPDNRPAQEPDEWSRRNPELQAEFDRIIERNARIEADEKKKDEEDAAKAKAAFEEVLKKRKTADGKQGEQAGAKKSESEPPRFVEPAFFDPKDLTRVPGVVGGPAQVAFQERRKGQSASYHSLGGRKRWIAGVHVAKVDLTLVRDSCPSEQGIVLVEDGYIRASVGQHGSHATTLQTSS
jgi:hypothetical protein